MMVLSDIQITSIIMYFEREKVRNSLTFMEIYRMNQAWSRGSLTYLFKFPGL